MALDALPVDDARAAEPLPAETPAGPLAILRMVLQPLASLWLTTALFAMAIFIVLVGTLAQVDMDMWEVIERYFRSLIARVDLQVFFPRSWFPHWQNIPGWMPFPGGLLIGLALFVNLLAAHLLRFKIQARGGRLWSGLGVLVVGGLLTWLVIASGHNREGLQGVPLVEYRTLWHLCVAAVVLLWLASAAGWSWLVARARHRRVELVLTGVTCGLLGALSVYLLLPGTDAYLGDSAMRILWQLIQGGLAGVVLLVGCVLVFRNQGGTVLLHAGIGLMMFGELWVSLHAREERITIEEGGTANYAVDIRQTELAVVAKGASPQQDDVIAVPRTMLLGALESQEPIEHPDLPFRIHVLEYWKSSELADVTPQDKNPATAGIGRQVLARPQRPGSGADSSGRVDMASAYVKFTGKADGQDLGTYLLSVYFSGSDMTDKVSAGGKTYEVALRFQRTYKPYSLTLLDVRKDDYLGTRTPRNYSSEVRLRDPTRHVDRQIKIWMNNPLRYAGETFYQSGYDQDRRTGKEMTTLQVVTNTGWMIPYVSCMLVATGMLAHFVAVLLRFLQRRSAGAAAGPAGEPANAAAPDAPRGRGGRRGRRLAAAAPGPRLHWIFAVVPALVVLLSIGWLAGKARPPRNADGAFDLYAFGQLPIVYQGRVKPLDTLARNSLRIISDREEFVDPAGQRQPAIRWLLDVITQVPEADQYRVFRIQNLEVLQTLQLPRRPGFRYAVEELRENIAEFEKQADAARQMPAEQMGIYEKKLLELERRIRTYTLLTAAFRPVSFPPAPAGKAAEDKDAVDKHMAALRAAVMEAMESEKVLQQMEAPLVVPVAPDKATTDPEAWLPYATAFNKSYLRQALPVQNQTPLPAVLSWSMLLDAYLRHDAPAFQTELAQYREWLAANAAGHVNLAKVRFESYFNHTALFYHCAVLYVFAFLLAAAGWLGWSRLLHRSALWLIVFIFLVHTLAVIGRVYISGRPPVTNLYSSAVFIGWGCVVLGLVLEAVFRLGFGNIVAAVAGFVTLLIAQFLAGSGDTFTVMQAVLDTQFWLATHVVCIALGYSTTFVAGLLGVLYVLAGVTGLLLSPLFRTLRGRWWADIDRTLIRMIYGVVCFSIFFNFVGTVLGGLWADDSWGRFWGWDPKENGALIIVLWNALLLHALRGRLVRGLGLALLAIGGNVVTAWSWFGVNELGVGLHSYGFTEGVLPALGLFALSQFVVIALGLLLWPLWRRFQDSQAVMAEVVH